MREKIYAYLTDIYTMQHSEKLVLPHNREQMAEALNVSRTALSRELGRLRDEGIIEINGRHVTLLDPQQIVEFGLTIKYGHVTQNRLGIALGVYCIYV